MSAKDIIEKAKLEDMVTTHNHPYLVCKSKFNEKEIREVILDVAKKAKIEFTDENLIVNVLLDRKTMTPRGTTYLYLSGKKDEEMLNLLLGYTPEGDLFYRYTEKKKELKKDLIVVKSKKPEKKEDDRFLTSPILSCSSDTITPLTPMSPLSSGCISPPFEVEEKVKEVARYIEIPEGISFELGGITIYDEEMIDNSCLFYSPRNGASLGLTKEDKDEIETLAKVFSKNKDFPKFFYYPKAMKIVYDSKSYDAPVAHKFLMFHTLMNGSVIMFSPRIK